MVKLYNNNIMFLIQKIYLFFILIEDNKVNLIINIVNNHFYNNNNYFNNNIKDHKINNNINHL